MILSDRGLTVEGSYVQAQPTIVEHKEVITTGLNTSHKCLILLNKICLTFLLCYLVL